MSGIAANLTKELAGRRCETFRFVEGGTLILYLRNENGVEPGSTRLWIDCAWRLTSADAVLVGSLDEADSVLRALQQVPGRMVREIEMHEKTGDLRLAFDNGLMIETFGYSVSGEHWELRRGDGFRTGIGPRYAAFERHEGPDRAPGEYTS